MRWNHCLMGWGGLPLKALDGFGLICFMRSHIHAWNIARGWMVEEGFGSAILHLVGTWKSHPRVGFYIINMRLFLFVFIWALYWIICGLYGCGSLRIYIEIMLVMCRFDDLIDELEANMLRRQWFLVILS